MTFLPEPVVEENFYWEDFGQLIPFWGILPNLCCMRWFHNLLWLFFLNYKKWGAIVEAHVHLKIPVTQCLFLNSECFHSSPCFISSCLSLLWWKWMADPPSLPGVKAMVVGVLRVHHKSACAGFVGVSPRDVPAPSLHLPFLSMSHAGVSVLGAVNEGSVSFLCKLLLEIIHWKSSRSLSYPQSSKILVEFFFVTRLHDEDILLLFIVSRVHKI